MLWYTADASSDYLFVVCCCLQLLEICTARYAFGELNPWHVLGRGCESVVPFNLIQPGFDTHHGYFMSCSKEG